MKISGKFILKVAGTLTIISLVVALLLGLVNGVTADKIAAMNAAAPVPRSRSPIWLPLCPRHMTLL